MADKKPSVFIGNAPCPLCRSAKARVSVSKQQLACLTCNSCNCQLFTRSERSDDLLRASIKAEATPPPAPAPAADPDPAPPPDPKPAPAKPARDAFDIY